jgi:hypothetical protein
MIGPISSHPSERQKNSVGCFLLGTGARTSFGLYCVFSMATSAEQDARHKRAAYNSRYFYKKSVPQLFRSQELWWSFAQIA